MKYSFLIVCLFVSVGQIRSQVYDKIMSRSSTSGYVPVVTNKSKGKSKSKTEISYHLGSGFFSMEEIKQLQINMFKEANLVLVDKPTLSSSILHTLCVSQRNGRKSVGIEGQYASTNVVSNTKDASSELACSSYNIALHMQYIFLISIVKNSMLETGLGYSIGTAMNNVTSKGSLTYSANGANELRSLGFSMEPSLFERIECNDWLSVELKCGYFINWSGNLGLKDNTGYVVSFDGRGYRPDWSGIRLSIGLVATL